MSTKGTIPWNKGKGTGWVHNGYRRVVINGKHVMEHRAVMEQHLGRKLEPWELVHHKDGNGLNNAVENLELQTWPDHTRQHATGRKLSYETKRSLTAFANMRRELERVRSVNSELVAVLDGIEASAVNLHCALQGTAGTDPNDKRIASITGQVVRDLLAVRDQARKALSDARNLSAGIEGGTR